MTRGNRVWGDTEDSTHREYDRPAFGGWPHRVPIEARQQPSRELGAAQDRSVLARRIYLTVTEVGAIAVCLRPNGTHLPRHIFTSLKSVGHEGLIPAPGTWY